MESLRIQEGLRESPVRFRWVAANVDEGGSQCKLVFTFRLKPKAAVMSVTGVGSSVFLLLWHNTQWCAHALMGGSCPGTLLRVPDDNVHHHKCDKRVFWAPGVPREPGAAAGRVAM